MDITKIYPQRGYTSEFTSNTNINMLRTPPLLPSTSNYLDILKSNDVDDESYARIDSLPQCQPRVESFETSSKGSNEEINICEISKRHSLTCTRCKKKEFFLSVLELVAYILTGLLLVLISK